jgi:S-disulfanyl-L-cysteine oxidoreductase SoxD
MSKYPKLLLIAALAFGGSPALAQKMGLGRAALPEEVAAWDKDVRPDGLGLPEGSGDVLTGEEVFSDKCAACHGEFAEGVDNWPKLAGGKGTLNREDPLKTVGSYWPHLSTVWDYVNRSMPFGNAQSLTADEVYAITAYILYSNDLVEDDFVLSKENFASFELPNAGGFFVDDREQTELAAFSAAPCMENCKPEVKITMHATVLDVTPGDPTDDAPAAEAPEAAPEAAPEVVAEAAPALDPELVAAGEKVFKKCAACHKVGDKAKNGSGPMLNGIVGRAAGSVDGFRYSGALMDAAAGGLVWNADALHGFLEKPKDFLPKTKMSFAGLKKAEDRDAIIAYLSTFGG